jgi:hypothetical protein
MAADRELLTLKEIQTPRMQNTLGFYVSLPQAAMSGILERQLPADLASLNATT